MKYSNEIIRRQDRLLEETAATELLKHAEYGILSMQAEKGGGYGIPVSYVWDGKSVIYIHCALEGEKTNCIKLNNKVSLCAVGRTNLLADRFTTEYESIILNCEASVGLSDDERMKALELILDKFSPQDKEVGMSYAHKSFGRTEIIRLDVLSWTGKSKMLKVDSK